MNSTSDVSRDLRRQAVEAFWDAFPPFWQQIRAHIRRLSEEQHGISVEQFHLLRHIRRGQGSVSELASVRNISRPAISQAVDVLVHKGLISRSPEPHDRRHVRLALTDAGNALLDSIIEDTRIWMMELLAPLSDQELEHLQQALKALSRIGWA